MREMPTTYNPAEFEGKIYEGWIGQNLFRAEIDPKKVPFTVMMPPPNVTGQLHMGHAMDETMQDVLARFKRMQGYSVLWLPGVDHAALATEVKVVEQLQKEGLTKEGLGREAFLGRVWDWKNKYGNRIVEQLKKLGCSCDWSRLAFTMDENCSKAVRETFFRLYEKGLVYRGSRIINWCPGCKTALSDIEVEYSEDEGSFWYFRYPLEGEEGFITIATTRPETMLGDTAVAVNPSDKRYAKFVGKTRDERRRLDERRGGCIRGARSLRGAQKDRRGYGEAGLARKNPAAHAQRGALLPLPRHVGADHLQAVVRKNGAARKARDRGGHEE